MRIDFFQSFTPMATLVTISLFFDIAFGKSWHIHQLKINCTFLLGYLDGEVYMVPPEDYLKLKMKKKKLERSLYGLKQASC